MSIDAIICKNVFNLGIILIFFFPITIGVRTTDDHLSRALAVPNVLIVFLFSQNKKMWPNSTTKNLSNSKPKKKIIIE